MKWIRFAHGAAVIGPGWLFRLGKLRILWAETPDPRVTKVVYEEESVVRLTITWDEFKERILAIREVE